MTPEQSAVLATIAYSDGFRKSAGQDTGKMKDKTLGDLLFPKDINGNTEVNPAFNRFGMEQDEQGNLHAKTAPTGYTQDEWNRLLDKVKNDPELLNLKIKDVSTNEYDSGTMLTLVDPNTRQAVIVFEGTTCSQGWDEDFKTGYTLTKSQQRAIEYTNERLKDLSGYYVYTTGHSKGGNEAALVAVECEGIDSAFAFDAPGNSESYFDDPAHADKAKRNSYKVTYYSNENCFVSPLNTRYKATEYWLKSGHNEWLGMEGLQEYLAFSPMAHSTNNLFDKDYNFEYASGPSDHQVELNRFTRWLENNFPSKECKELLDAIGLLVAKLKYTDGNVYLGKNDADYAEWSLDKLLALLDPKVVALLLLALDDYPYTSELLDSVLADGLVDRIKAEYGDDIKAWVSKAAKTGAYASLLMPKTTAFVALLGVKLGAAYLASVLFYQKVTRIKMKARDKAKQAVRTVVKVYYAFHTHNFSEDMLSRIEGIVGSFKGMPFRRLYQDWKWLYAVSGIFNWMSLAFIDATVDSATKLLDSAVDGALQSIRQKFQQAWSADSTSGGVVAQSLEPVAKATKLLQGLVQH